MSWPVKRRSVTPQALRAALAALFAAVLAGVALQVAASQPAVSAEPTPVRVMPLGDSITGSPGCWRAMLWNRLQNTGYTNVDFVGTLGPQGCGVSYDGDNEGHGGFLVTNVANQNQLPAWLSVARPDVVLMHFGTNDVWSNIPPATILNAYTTLVGQMRAHNPNMRVLVAKIIPMNPSSCSACAQRVIDLNAVIPGWAAGLTTAQSPIVVVDQWTGFSTAADTYDGVHPNAAGDQKMANRWYPALTPYLVGGSPSPSASASATPSPSVSPSASPSPSVSPSAAPSPSPSPSGPSTPCVATLKVVGQWPGGFQGDMTIRNTGTQTTNGWQVMFVLPSGMTITQIWGGRLTQTGSTIIIRNEAWNGSIPVGGTATAGFLGNWTGAGAIVLPNAMCTTF